ncbi:hypothetical protein CUMW_174020 [Citrus unshiu]|nr:hypothetical protein CUMW_174020 [Citrus unshiu]
MQMTMMSTPNINKELQYLNKEDRLLRWLLVKHRGMKNGKEARYEETSEADLKKYGPSAIYDFEGIEEEDNDEEEYDSEEDAERKEH